jgi:hypothetical protein
MTRVDTVTLTSIINQCFDFAADQRLTESQQDKFRAHGKRLRGALVNLLTMQFVEGTELLNDANTRLSEVNDELPQKADDLRSVADTLNNLAKLASTLDKLLNVVVIRPKSRCQLPF